MSAYQSNARSNGRHRVDVRLIQIHPVKPDARRADLIRHFTLDDQSPNIILGRASKNRFLSPSPTNLWVESPIVTKEHARFIRGPSLQEPLLIRDLNSTHGTFVAGTRVTTDCGVAVDDVLQFGDYIDNGPIHFEPPTFVVEYDVHPVNHPPTPITSSPESEMPSRTFNHFQVPEPDDRSDMGSSEIDDDDVDAHFPVPDTERLEIGRQHSVYSSSDNESDEEEDDIDIDPEEAEEEEEYASDQSVYDGFSRPHRHTPVLEDGKSFLHDEAVRQHAAHFPSSRASSVQSSVPPLPPAPKMPHVRLLEDTTADTHGQGSSPNYPIVLDDGLESHPPTTNLPPVYSEPAHFEDSVPEYRPRSPKLRVHIEDETSMQASGAPGQDAQVRYEDTLSSPTLPTDPAHTSRARQSSPSDAALAKSAKMSVKVWNKYTVPELPGSAPDLWSPVLDKFAEAPVPAGMSWAQPVPSAAPAMGRLFPDEPKTTPAEKRQTKPSSSAYTDGPFAAPRTPFGKRNRSSLPIEELINPPATNSARKRTMGDAGLDQEEADIEPRRTTRAPSGLRRPVSRRHSPTQAPPPPPVHHSSFLNDMDAEDEIVSVEDIVTEDEMDEEDIDQDDLSVDLNLDDFGQMITPRVNENLGLGPVFGGRTPEDMQTPVQAEVDDALTTLNEMIRGDQMETVNSMEAAFQASGAAELQSTALEAPESARGSVLQTGPTTVPEQKLPEGPSPPESGPPRKKVKTCQTSERASRPRLGRFMSKAVPFMTGAAATAATIFAGAGMLISTMHDELMQEALLDLGL